MLIPLMPVAEEGIMYNGRNIGGWIFTSPSRHCGVNGKILLGELGQSLYQSCDPVSNGTGGGGYI